MIIIIKMKYFFIPFKLYPPGHGHLLYPIKNTLLAG